MEPTNTLNWRTEEHHHIERGSDWYWALGIIALSTATTAILFSNFFFALLIIVGAATLGLIVSKKPLEVDFELSEQGLVVNDEFYAYDHMFAFWIEIDENEKASLLIDTPRIMTPDLVVPLADVDPATVREIFIEKGVPETPLRESFYHKVLELFGF